MAGLECRSSGPQVAASISAAVVLLAMAWLYLSPEGVPCHLHVRPGLVQVSEAVVAHPLHSVVAHPLCSVVACPLLDVGAGGSDDAGRAQSGDSVTFACCWLLLDLRCHW